MNDSKGKTLLFLSPVSKFIFLALALTIPAVTVEVKLNGLPTASTQSPISTSSEFPNSVNGRLFSSILSNAISVPGSEPTNLALSFLPSFKVTDNSSALSIT